MKLFFLVHPLNLFVVTRRHFPLCYYLSLSLPLASWVAKILSWLPKIRLSSSVERSLACCWLAGWQWTISSVRPIDSLVVFLEELTVIVMIFSSSLAIDGEAKRLPSNKNLLFLSTMPILCRSSSSSQQNSDGLMTLAVFLHSPSLWMEEMDKKRDTKLTEGRRRKFLFYLSIN